MPSFSFGYKAAGALFLAAFLIFISLTHDTVSPQLWIIFLLALVANLFAILSDTIGSNRWSKALAELSKQKAKSLGQGIELALKALGSMIAVLVIFPLIFSIASVAGAFAFAELLKTDIVETDAIGLIVGIFPLLSGGTAVCCGFEVFSHLAAKDDYGLNKNAILRTYASMHLDVRMFISTSLGLLFLASIAWLKTLIT